MASRHHECMNTKSNGASVPTVSYLSPDGTVVELLYNRVERTTALAVSRSDGSVSVEPFLDLASDERLVPYSPTNNLITTGCVLLPSAVGAYDNKVALVAEVQAFIHRYVDLTPLFEEIAVYYVLLSWVFDAFNELGYLRFRGDYGTGKTRALLTIGSLCYKPFFASGASTVSPIFHVLEAFQGTLVLDEADFRFSDATAELTKILNNGNVVGLPVLRTMANRHRELNPQAFRVFGPKLVAMRQGFNDPALESRFLTEETSGRTMRSGIPLHLPDSLALEAEALRNTLLSWRFRSRASVGVDPARAIVGVEPRANQSALALLSLIDDDGLRTRIGAELLRQEGRVLEERAASLDAVLLRAVCDVMGQRTGDRIPVSAVAEAFNQRMASEGGGLVSPKWVGGMLRNRLRLVTSKSHGVYGVPLSERSKIDALALRFGVSREQAVGTCGSKRNFGSRSEPVATVATSDVSTSY